MARGIREASPLASVKPQPAQLLPVLVVESS